MFHFLLLIAVMAFCYISKGDCRFKLYPFFAKHLLKILFIYRERRREVERDGEKHQCVVASHASPTRDLAHNPDMCPDWE